MDYKAPQWVDFTESCSPQVPTQDYFEKEHTIQKPIKELCDSTATENLQYPLNDVSCTSKEAQEDLKKIINTPVKVISPKYGNKKKEEITYNQMLTDAMKKLNRYTKPLKTQNVPSKNIQESNILKTPVVKLSKSLGHHLNTNRNVCTPEKNSSVHKTKISTNSSLFKQNQSDSIINNVKKPDCATDNCENNKIDKEHNEEDNSKIVEIHEKLEEPCNNRTDGKNNKENEKDVVDASIEIHKETQPNKQRRRTAAVLTWQNGKRNLTLRRTSNQYISLAEAVSRFQTETPKRFRTKSNKDLSEGVSQNIPKLQFRRLKSTIPISPALISKNRTRATTVLSQEEREKQELEEMKKYQIKANPIPPNVLRGPMRPMGVKVTTDKPITAATMNVAEFPSSSSSAVQQSVKVSAINSARLKTPGTSHHNKKSSKNIVTKVVVTDPTGIIVKREEINFFGIPKNTGVTKNMTRFMPFSFEARDKALQMRKEQRMKNLQVANEAKTEFHARPAPNFSKQTPTTLSKQQQQQSAKKSVQPCPFSFDERDKNLLKKKETLVKQVLAKDKQMRMFRANPVPVFKPVMVRGVSTEQLSKVTKVEKKDATDGHDNQENEEPNIIVPEKEHENKNIHSKSKNISHFAISKQNITSFKDEKIVTKDVTKATLPRELNTDKRARKRREFDEKIKLKEMEEETKQEEENKKQFEHEKQVKANLRKLAEVKAKPMPIYKPPTIVKSLKPLTEPQSPAFASKIRSNQV